MVVLAHIVDFLLLGPALIVLIGIIGKTLIDRRRERTVESEEK